MLNENSPILSSNLFFQALQLLPHIDTNSFQTEIAKSFQKKNEIVGGVKFGEMAFAFHVRDTKAMHFR